MAKRMQSVNKHSFKNIPDANIQRSVFDRSHGHKTTFDAGYLIPVYVDEALPGDTFKLNMTGFARLATPLKPIMDNMFMETFFFAVPNRLLWDNWQKFNGEQDNPGDSVDFTVPVLSDIDVVQAETLADHMGLPVGITYDGMKPNALHFRAYNLIYNEWFRDENLQDSIPMHRDDGPDTAPETDYVLRRRGKRRDYFTSCLPWPQKGEAASLPLGSTAPIIADPDQGNPFFQNSTGFHASLNTSDPGESTEVNVSNVAYGANEGLSWGTDTGQGPGLLADLDAATTVTINSMREAFQIQRLLERDARGGTRYTEILRSHFGVSSPDSRLQRPEYLGGGSSPINMTAIPQTSEGDTEGTPQANLAAYGTTVLQNHGFTKSFTEHCTIIGLVSVRADLTYQRGLDRMWSRQTRYDYYWPALSHLGEQAVLQKEIFALGVPSVDDTVFGYQERYAEYRYKPSLITGKFRSVNAQSLDIWHLSQDWETPPALNEEFIVEDPPIDRIIAVPSEPHFLFDSFLSLRCARPMPVYSVPGHIDHF